MWELDYKEIWRIDAFELWCWWRLLRVPWTARRSNQSILKEVSPEYSLEGLMLRLKVQYFGHQMQRIDSFEKTLMLGKIEGGEGDDWGWGGWMASPTRWTWVWVNSGIWWWTGKTGLLQSMVLQRVGCDWETELNWVYLDRRPDIPGVCAALFFTALDFPFTTRHIHSRRYFPLWPNHFIFSGVISNCCLLFPNSILNTFQPGGLMFRCHIFMSFHLLCEVL